MGITKLLKSWVDAFGNLMELSIPKSTLTMERQLAVALLDELRKHCYVNNDDSQVIIYMARGLKDAEPHLSWQLEMLAREIKRKGVGNENAL